jgi:hypothetical protein
MFVFPLSGTNSAEGDRKFITYYAFLLRMDEMTSKLAELEKVVQEKNCRIEKLNVIILLLYKYRHFILYCHNT